MFKNVKQPGPAATVILVIMLIALGYGAVWFIDYHLAAKNTAVLAILQLVSVFILLGIAYGILKGVFHYVRLKDVGQQEFKAKDLPKDSDVMAAKASNQVH